MRVDRVGMGLLVVGLVLGWLVGVARATQGPGGGESNPFAALQADASANLFTGAASITVPILVPPGRKNVTPELALRYSSHAGLSFVGYGWALPLGVLSRTLEQGTPSCLGSDPERFRLLLAASANDLVRASADRFLLELDEGYAEAIPDRAANTWTVRTRDGMTYTFGGSDAARVHQGADRFHDQAACAFTTAWHVTRLTDPNGNVLEIEWEKTGNTPLPSAIHYGGNTPASIPHPFRIRFESEDLEVLGRPILRSLASGVDQELLRRIARIVVEARATANGEFEEVRRYDLDYDDSLDTAEFLLAAVAGTDLPTRRFGYSSSTPTIVDDLSESVPDPDTLGASLDFGSILALMDLNGDGLLDRLCVGGTGEWHAAYGESGQVQFTGYSSCGGAGNWHVPPIPGVNPDRISKVVEGQDVYLTLDLDADGLPDLVRRDPNGATIRVHRGHCTSAWDCGFEDQPLLWNNPLPANDRALRRTVTGNRGQQTLHDLVDLDGDGRPDLVRALANGDWELYRNLGSGFASAPSVLPAMDVLLGYAPSNNQNAEEERALIDVNGDGLVDWISGVHHDQPRNQTQRIPSLYFGVGPQGDQTGPFPLAGGPYLCPTSLPGQQAVLCAGGSALPAGWAIVGAASVRLNTGSGFAAPVYTPAPFWDDADETANRLRASWTASGSRETRIYRDFADMNGDGRIDWVTTGYPYDGSPNWYVLYNQGDGRFGGGLEVLAPASPGLAGAFLGRVRPRATIANVDAYLGRSFQHTQPPDRVDRQMLILDVDADGLVERVKAFGIGGSDRWELKRLRYADGDGAGANGALGGSAGVGNGSGAGGAGAPSIRPLLLTRVEDGIGGVTHLRHAPSSRFVPPPAIAPRLPFVTWLVTGIRRTDGLCDAPPTDWFTLAGNPCLAEGHELVERFEYEGGAYDGLGREFLGFAKTRVFEGPAELGSLRELEFHQSHALKGRIARESVYAGGVDLLARTTSTWQLHDDGPRTQVQLQEERIETFALYSQFGGGTPQCVVHRNSILHPDGHADPQSRIQTTCSMACAGAGSASSLCEPLVPGKKEIETTWADPVAGAASPVWDRPAQIVTRHVDAAGALQTTAVIRHAYDGLGHGATDRGRVTSERSTIEVGPDRDAFKLFVYDAGQPVGPGNVTSILLPVTGQSRAPKTIEFDGEFALHPVRETASVSNTGAAAERRIESRYDLRFGERIEVVGLHGRGAGDVSGTVLDRLGRPVCEYEPRTVCGASSGFGASLEYRYAYGDPSASDPLARLSSVEVRRREPNAPGGFLVTRSWFDALGRERLTTNQQNVADPAAPTGLPALETVVARHLEYGPNGKPVRAFAPWVAPGGTPTLSPPNGAATSETSYVLNGNPAGRLDPAGRPFEVVAYDGSRTRSYFFGDTMRRVDGISAAGSGGHHTVELHDVHGRPIERRSLQAASLQLAQWNGEYDGRDRLVAEWFGGSLATRITRRYDLLGRAIETVDPDAGRWRIRYDEVGNETFRDDPKANESIQSCYDGLDRVVLQCVRASDQPDASLCGQAAPACDIAYRYRYDEATPVLSTPNKGLGHLTTVEGPDGRHRYVYDVRGRRVLSVDEIQGSLGATRYRYAPDVDRLEGMTYPDGEIVRYDYDESGQAISLNQVDAAGRILAGYVSDVAYDLRGRPLWIARGNLTSDRFEYHGAAEGFALARITSRSDLVTVPGSSLVYSDLAYRDYDTNGRLLRVDDLRDPSGALSMTARYAYDGVGRLTDVTGARPEAFVYDSIGNLRSLDGSAFAQSSGASSPLGPHQFDRLGSASSTHWTMTWDENGRRTGKRRSDGSVVQTYGYDAFGSLRALAVNGVLTQMGYDHAGRRILESRQGTVRRIFGRHAESVNGELVKYYYLGARLIATRSDPPVTTAGAVSGAIGGIFEAAPVRPLVLALAGLLVLVPLGRARPALGLRIARSGALGSSLLVLAISLPVVVPNVGCLEPPNIRHYHLDHLGTPVAISGRSGDLERQYRHSVYGKMRRFDGEGRASGADASNRREFTGYESDEASGLQYAGSRFYDPDQASFLTPDPADEHASPYAYVGWDPVNAVDPNGAELTLVAAILLAISAVLVVASAIVAGVQSGSAAVGFKALGIGVAGLAAGYVVGLAAPAAASASLISSTSASAINSTLSVAAIGASVYGLTAAEDTSSRILAGAGLAVSLAGAAYAVGGLGRARGGASGPGASGGADGSTLHPSGEIVRTSHLSPSTAQRLALETQRRMVQIAQFTALAKVRSGIAEIRAQFLGQRGIDVYADVLVEGPRIPHPTRLFGEHLLPNKVEVAPVVVPTGRGPTPSWMAPVPWDRFRLHEVVPVLRNGAAVKPN